ncbi:MAG: ABC transporter substrate-binding protein [Kiritimatiellae bacterium]|nr:ABC transporter substrate-binding protein [Kiritimatiellia bacterium]
MLKNASILLAAAVVIAVPFLLRSPEDAADWKKGDPVLVIITPHNEAIRYEFARAFSDWHRARHGQPVKVEWRAIGGTTEIMRYLVSEYVAAARAWRLGKGRPWPPGAGEAVCARSLDANQPPEIQDIYREFRDTDDASEFTCRIDLFFGGGAYDHGEAFRQGLTVMPWPPDNPPPGLFATEEGTLLIPEGMSGEQWHTATMFGNVLSTFGICYNFDRLRDLGIQEPPSHWNDLADPAYFRQVGVADPTKSGSIAKAFEMIFQQKCREAVAAAGFDDADVERHEAAIRKANLSLGDLPDGVPPAYQAAVERGWVEGLRLVQRIGANARYFTDSASKVPIDVGMGDAAVGLAIDFYGRFQAQCSRGPNGEERMAYVTPMGGSSVSTDPIGLLRGAEHREVAVRFMEFVLSEDGQRLWTYRPGTPGGPKKFALRRLPIRRDFYQFSPGGSNIHREYAADDLADPAVNPYALAENFTYRSRWTGRHFGVHRDLIKAMCLDSGDELRAAWGAILEHGGPERQTEAVALLARLPDQPAPLTWRSAPDMTKKHDRMECLRAWTEFYRESYREAKRMAEGKQEP